MQEPREPQRASLRLQGIASDGSMVAEELRNGQIVLSALGTAGGAGQQPPRAPKEPDQPRAMPTGGTLGPTWLLTLQDCASPLLHCS
jgi:hypothetical protein